MSIDTKLKADIAESAVVTELLRRGFRVLKPIGDRLPYDLAIDNNGRLNTFYIMPVSVFNGYKSEISLVEIAKRQRKPKSAEYRERWNLLCNGQQIEETP